jgi:hypothetical protein
MAAFFSSLAFASHHSSSWASPILFPPSPFLPLPQLPSTTRSCSNACPRRPYKPSFSLAYSKRHLTACSCRELVAGVMRRVGARVERGGKEKAWKLLWWTQ